MRASPRVPFAIATTMRVALPTVLLSLPLVAQIPTDTVLVLQSTSSVTVPNYRFVDVRGGGDAPLSDQNVFLQPSPVSVAVDPVDPAQFFFQANTSSLGGTWRTQVGLLGSSGQTSWGPWFQGAGTRLEVGASRVFALRLGNVESCSRVPGGAPPAVLFPLASAVDLAVNGSLLYAASFDPGVPAPLVEYDTTTATQRLVGSYVGVRAVAASPIVPELCLGLQNGDLLRVDLATGAVLSTTPTGLGSLVAVGYTRFGTLVWADAQQLWSELVPTAPVYVAATPIVDFGVAAVATASVVPFGPGCGLGALASWSANGLPTLGNAGFQLGLVDGPASSLAILALGGSRYFASGLGLALPLDLQGLGASGCDLLVDPQVLLAKVTNPAGGATQVVPIPATPALAGSEFVAQWFVADAGVGPLGLAGTAGVAFVVR